MLRTEYPEQVPENDTEKATVIKKSFDSEEGKRPSGKLDRPPCFNYKKGQCRLLASVPCVGIVLKAASVVQLALTNPTQRRRN